MSVRVASRLREGKREVRRMRTCSLDEDYNEPSEELMNDDDDDDDARIQQHPE